jgi:TonB family protein
MSKDNSDTFHTFQGQEAPNVLHYRLNCDARTKINCFRIYSLKVCARIEPVMSFAAVTGLSFMGEDWNPATVLSGLSWLSGPALCAYAIWYRCTRLRQRLPPLLLTAIPLALTSVSVQLAAAGFTILSGFRQISEQKTTGVSAVAEIFVGVRHSLMSRLIECAACVVIVAVSQMLLRSVSLEEVEIDAIPITPKTNAWPAVAMVAVSAILWLYGDIENLVMMTTDPARAAEARARLGDMGLDGVAALLSERIVVLACAALVVSVALGVVGWRYTRSGEARQWDFAASGVLALLVLQWCVAGTIGTLQQIRYLDHVVNSSGYTMDASRAGFPRSIEDLLDLIMPPQPLPVAELLSIPPPPPPPPPPPDTISSSPRPAPEMTKPRRARVSAGVAQGLLIHGVAPLYPPLARAARIQGMVVLRAVIGKDGSVQSVKVMSGHPMLEQAAVDAVMQWSYHPYLQNGEAVEMETEIAVKFILEG